MRSLPAVRWGCARCGGTNPDATRFCGHCGARNEAVEASPAEPRIGELRLVTALFADISGFTALSEQLAPDDLAEVIDPILVALGEIVDRHGGFINKYAGDAVLALFGAPVAHEDDVSRALAAALEMHREVDRLLVALPRSAADLTLHIGVNTGHAVARAFGADARVDYSVIGDAVNTAQRIEAAARPGETLVGERTWELGRDEFDLEPSGEIEARGKATPLRVFRLVGVRSAAAAPVPTTASGPVLVGRHAQMVDLESVIDRLRAGDGGVLVVIGDAGVGKSARPRRARRPPRPGDHMALGPMSVLRGEPRVLAICRSPAAVGGGGHRRSRARCRRGRPRRSAGGHRAEHTH